MKTIGLIGGMSWESTQLYYKYINELVRQKLGGLHSADLLLRSFNFADIESLQASKDWGAATDLMVEAARKLEHGGADCLLICTNTMHRMAEEVQAAIQIPLIHIADATAAAIKKTTCQRPLLLATRYTMEQAFYKGRLQEKHDLPVLVPDDNGRSIVHDIIYSELCQGVINEASRESYMKVVEKGISAGADGVIFGCTEVGLLLRASDLSVPAFDTTALHAESAVSFALNE